MKYDSDNFELNRDSKIKTRLLEKGLYIPVTDSEIKYFESLLGNTPIELPENFQTPAFIFENENKDFDLTKYFSETDQLLSVEILARAAREGFGEIPHDILEKMKINRQRIEGNE